MTISEKRKLLSIQLDENLKSLAKSLEILDHSYVKCGRISLKKHYDLDEQESFEALASRFARTSDILTQKVLKTFFMLMQEDIKGIIDGANFLEKIGVLENADDLLNIRELRNQIAHEYVDIDLQALFSDIIRNVPLLKTIISNIKRFIIERSPFISP
jgi:uncharacterized protein YutE (UPF0331/DUF86 family)